MPLDLSHALDRQIDRVTAGQGEVSVTGSLQGVEVGLGYKPKSWLSLGGYAGRLWKGSWNAGARASVTWGGKS